MNRRTMLKSLGLIAVSGIVGDPKAIAAAIETTGYPVTSTCRTDILVIGGGTAGVVAAIQGSRLGRRTILVEAGSQLGGTMTTGGVAFPGLFHAWGRQVVGGIGWELVSEAVAMNNDTMPDFSKDFGRNHPLHQIPLNGYLYALLAEEKCIDAGVDVRYYESPCEIRRRDGYWNIKISGKGHRYEILARYIIDCTGDAAAAALAGYSRERDKEIQPGSLIFELEGYDYTSLDHELLRQRFDDAIASGALHKSDAYNGVGPLLTVHGGLATQHVPGADSSTSASHSMANIEGRASLLRILRFVKSLPGCENARIKSMQTETAIRETYRIDSLYRVTADDYVVGRTFPDSLAYSYYPIDLHHEGGVEPAHLSKGVVATIPLRSLIPRGGKNFLVAGRCIGSDRLSNSALRVQASCMAMGQMAACAASAAMDTGSTVEDVPVGKIREMLQKNGAIVP